MLPLYKLERSKKFAVVLDCFQVDYESNFSLLLK